MAAEAIPSDPQPVVITDCHGFTVRKYPNGFQQVWVPLFYDQDGNPVGTCPFTDEPLSENPEGNRRFAEGTPRNPFIVSQTEEN